MPQRPLVTAVLLLSSARFSVPLAARARWMENASGKAPSAAPQTKSSNGGAGNATQGIR